MAVNDEQRAAMTDLLARVEAGDLWPDGSGDALSNAYTLIELALNDDDVHWNEVVGAYGGDLNDALALLGWLLPGAWMLLSGETDGPFSAVVHDGIADEVDSISGVSFARALLISTLKAKLGAAE